MTSDSLISNERQARRARSRLARIDDALSYEEILERMVGGMPGQAVAGFHRSLQTEHRQLVRLIDMYESASSGDVSLMQEQAGNDPESILVIARLARGMTQKDLARRAGLREQQIQRYERERYRSITLSNFQKLASVLGVQWTFDLFEPLRERYGLNFEVPKKDMLKAVKHARENGWLTKAEQSQENAVAELTRLVTDHVNRHGTPSLLRTGLNVVDHTDDWSLLSWKAQVTRLAQHVIDEGVPQFEPLDLSWVMELVRLSKLKDGPLRAVELLRERGIVVIVEKHISGMRVDGAAFLLDDTPVIGLTLRTDAVDSFWFSLLHELAHVILHRRTGLSAGFFDEFRPSDGEGAVDGFEQEADEFASNLLIPEDRWRKSPVRISKKPEHIEAFAHSLGIHPAIVFGRIRMERKNGYALFSNKIGRGTVRKLFWKVREKQNEKQ